jgi:AcrR family transcriptional regulator
VVAIGDAGGAADAAVCAVPGNGGPRSAGTRQAILEAARSAFAARGYDRTTIRGVAREAGVDASMVMRYFGSKAGLFTTAATADLPPPDLRAVPEADRGEALIRHLIARWEDPASRDRLMILLRTAVTSDEVAEQLQTVLGELITGSIAAAGIPDAVERGEFVRAQMLGLALCRYVLRQEPLASLPLEQVVATVAPSVQRYLHAPTWT